jgi:diaminopimelate epimerase
MLFSKYVGSGNDFILVDNRDLSFPIDNHLFISKLCHRQFGIGADGVILLENSKTADYKMRIFNADGSEAEMCGNGIRCFFKFINECGGDKASYLIETKEAKIQIKQDENSTEIKVSMQEPIDLLWNKDLKIDSEILKIHHINTGVPHTVIFTDEIQDEDIKIKAPKIRYHENFPKGTNVNFASISGESQVTIRTYERGVEDETLSCGTGATAAAIAAAFIYNLKLPIRVKTKSGEELEIDCTINQSIIKDVTMKGPAVCVYRGQFHGRS